MVTHITYKISGEHTNSHRDRLSSAAYLYLHSCQLPGGFATTAESSLQTESKADKNNTDRTKGHFIFNITQCLSQAPRIGTLLN